MELKRCPFCGNDATIFKLDSGIDRLIMCKSDECICGDDPKYFKSDDEAIAAWNKRA
ncbi:unnamed protein product [marine sediment metagenome]|uniref:Restriction alleviation protein, Lar family n=1 Tax=marine sediment metagenome TaxID=412755 RepID=X1AIN8_9ZZZZ